jgi:hypothetical protein
MPDNETIAGIFPGKVIIVDHGKIVFIPIHKNAHNAQSYFAWSNAVSVKG